MSLRLGLLDQIRFGGCLWKLGIANGSLGMLELDLIH